METKADYGRVLRRLEALALLRPLLDDAVVAGLAALLRAAGGGTPLRVPHAATAAALYAAGGDDLGAYLLEAVSGCENPAVRLASADKPLPEAMRQALDYELETFTLLCRLPFTFEEEGVRLPCWQCTEMDFKAEYAARLAEIHSRGYGIFARNHMFTLEEGRLLPVRNPDPQRLSDLTGYDRERGQVLVNTRALLRGLPANNILLYGDAGTGKSSTVKAIANEFRDEGLRLVEVRKNQLYSIPGLMDMLADNPLKFILFIDDLSFPADDGDFTALKAILEGNISARPANIVVYATSNRRHMVKEKYSDRLGDDMHLGDTLEEEASLSARFGLTITFLKPDRELYAGIVLALAAENGLRTAQEELVKLAEAHAIRYGGRSPRTARQFVEYMRAVEHDN